MSDTQETIDGFIIDYLSDFGQGAFSSCYKCYNPKYQIPLCVKIILPSQHVSQMFDREIEILQHISQIDCNFLVKILHISKQSQKCFFFMEYCQQGDLQNLIKQNQALKRSLQITEILQILSQVINGYKQLYDFGIIHRDIKPANILLGNHGYYQLTDYGMAKILQDPSLKLEQSSVGTPNYAAPQILIEGIYSNKCDVYSLGVLIYELVYQQLPIKGFQYFQFLQALKNTKQNKIEIKTFPPELGGSINEKKQLYDFLNRSIVYEESSRISWEELFKLFPDPTNSIIIRSNQQQEQFQSQQLSHDLKENNKEMDHQKFSYFMNSNDSLIKTLQSQNQNQSTQTNKQIDQMKQSDEITDISQNQFYHSAETSSQSIQSPSIKVLKSVKLIKKKSIISSFTWQDDLLDKVIQFYQFKSTFAEILLAKIKNIFYVINLNKQIMSYTPYYTNLYLLQILVVGYQYSCYLNIYYLLFKRDKSYDQLQILKDLYEIDKEFLNYQIQVYLNKQEQIIQGQKLKENFKLQKIKFKEYQKKFQNFELNQQINIISKKESLYSPQFYYKKYQEKFDLMNFNFDLEAEYDYLENHTIQHLAFSIKLFQNELKYQNLTEILQANEKSIVEYSEEKIFMLKNIKRYFQNKQKQSL
ncbi:unnamed protein product [Paramecium sonneborni]|uniref:Protein kinase domain-containing protein n=1 Tax=Paramecium sonneborni TaxID=65129 RepID=A0A8S1QW63_9CILI|nr:unnamed protein product [Paramecium sonneborni]